MTKIRYVDYSADEMVAGVSGQIDEAEFGVYWMICTLIYSQGGPIRDDPEWISRLFRRSTPRRIRGIVSTLIEAGKVQRIGDKLMVERCGKELEKARKRTNAWAKNGAKGGRPSNVSNDLEEPKGFKSDNQTLNHQPPTTNHKDSSLRSESPPPKPAAGSGDLLLDADTGDVLQEALGLYNATAGEIGLPKAQVLNQARQSRLRARLKQAGGIEGWKAALAKAAASPLIRGEKTNWRGDLDFLLQESSFIKLMEGGYDPVPGAQRQGASVGISGVMHQVHAMADEMDRRAAGEEPAEEFSESPIIDDEVPF